MTKSDQGRSEGKIMNIRLETVDRSEFSTFRRDVKDVFARAVIEEFGDTGEDIISDEDIDKSLFSPNADIHHIYLDNAKIGGAVVSTDPAMQRNHLDLFYIYPAYHSKGYGLLAWKLIEEKYPQTKVWELITPYFERRNINFYVNKCGFHITEFFNKHHKDAKSDVLDTEFGEEYFRFEKKMFNNATFKC